MDNMGENKYQNGKIYKIVDVGYNKCYIGSTCESLSQRMARHRIDYKRYQQGKGHYKSSFAFFDEFGLNNCKIELIEYCNVLSKGQLCKYEGQYIRETECINKRIECRSKKQYYNDNKELITSKNKIYRNTHADTIKMQKSQHYQENKDYIKQKGNDYYANNKEKVKQRMREYRARKKAEKQLEQEPEPEKTP